jgi:hypothetical protein
MALPIILIHARAMVRAAPGLAPIFMVTALHCWRALVMIFGTTRAAFHPAIRTTT